MTWRDKLEIGLREDAPYRRDNLPETEQKGPEQPAGPGRSPVVASAVKVRPSRRRATASGARTSSTSSKAARGQAPAKPRKKRPARAR